MPLRQLKSIFFSFFSFFSTSKCLDLFLVTPSLMAFNLASKYFFVIKLLTSDILASISVILALKFVFVTKLIISGILPSISVSFFY